MRRAQCEATATILAGGVGSAAEERSCVVAVNKRSTAQARMQANLRKNYNYWNILNTVLIILCYKCTVLWLHWLFARLLQQYCFNTYLTQKSKTFSLKHDETQ